MLAKLQDEVPPHNIQTIRFALKRELKGLFNDLIEIDPLPIGSASIAQVHRAVLASGEEVAVKVQYPELKRQYPLDIWLMLRLTRLFSRVFARALDARYDFN